LFTPEALRFWCFRHVSYSFQSGEKADTVALANVCLY